MQLMPHILCNLWQCILSVGAWSRSMESEQTGGPSDGRKYCLPCEHLWKIDDKITKTCESIPSDQRDQNFTRTLASNKSYTESMAILLNRRVQAKINGKSWTKLEWSIWLSDLQAVENGFEKLRNSPAAWCCHHHVWQWGWCFGAWMPPPFCTRSSWSYCAQIVLFLFRQTRVLYSTGHESRQYAPEQTSAAPPGVFWTWVGPYVDNAQPPQCCSVLAWLQTSRCRPPLLQSPPWWSIVLLQGWPLLWLRPLLLHCLVTCVAVPSGAHLHSSWGPSSMWQPPWLWSVGPQR